MVATIILLFLETIKLGCRLANHGKEIKLKCNFLIDLILFLITMTLFYFAGLFDKFNI